MKEKGIIMKFLKLGLASVSCFNSFICRKLWYWCNIQMLVFFSKTHDDYKRGKFNDVAGTFEFDEKQKH